MTQYADQDGDFSDAFCAFVQSSVATVDAAELLLLLYRSPTETWTPSGLAAKMDPGANLSEADAAKYVETFQQRGLVVTSPDGRVRYQPGSPELDGHVQTLAKLYHERPVTLFRVIYTLRDTKIKTFADAFEIWRK